MNSTQKKMFKVVSLIFLLVVLSGCARTVDAQGNIIKPITSETPWTLSAGIFDFLFIMPIAKFILFVEPYIGAAFGVILATVIINLLTLPLMIKSQVSTQKMQMLMPKQEAIQRKYKGRTDKASQMRMSAEIQALYKKNNISMSASFMPFLTLPIMFAMWNAAQRLPILRETVFFGINLGAKPMTQMGDWRYILIIVLVGITQFLSMEISKILMKKQKGYRENKAMDSMKYMNYFMVVMIIFMAYSMETAMSIYWITTSTITIIRTIYIHYNHVAKVETDEPRSYLDKKKKK
ncbi:MAG: membrane protein insertase YidC [Erysipelotrichaceae bacterium]|nr:membrane protein insertase YidC [Erysipelotrichaceae bacterium]